MTVFGPWRIVPERPGWNQGGASATTCTFSGERPSTSRSASASALASKAETAAAFADQWRPLPSGLALPRRIAAAAVN